MILYFSATGNNKYIAQQIASAIDDSAVSMEVYTEKVISLKENESLGIVVPTYFLELPLNVVTFLHDVSFVLPDGAFVFGIVTYGSTSGACGAHLKKVFTEKGITIDALHSIITPDTWTPTFDLSNPAKVRKTLVHTETQLSRAISRIKAKERGDFRTRRLPLFVTKFSDPAYQRARLTSHFLVEDACVGCGLCAKQCPTKTIEINESKPTWIKEQCIACLRCLHSCPKFTIQYKDKTVCHGQYLHSKYTGSNVDEV